MLQTHVGCENGCSRTPFVVANNTHEYMHTQLYVTYAMRWSGRRQTHYSTATSWVSQIFLSVCVCVCVCVYCIWHISVDSDVCCVQNFYQLYQWPSLLLRWQAKVSIISFVQMAFFSHISRLRSWYQEFRIKFLVDGCRHILVWTKASIRACGEPFWKRNFILNFLYKLNHKA